MEVIGKYRLVRKLAEGGMAEVFLAQVEGPGGFLKPVVVKRVLPELSKDQSFVSMFMSEAKLVAQLNHPNIVQVFDFGLHNGSYFLVMEYVDGHNLRGLYKRAQAAKEPIPYELAARMVAAACEGLAYAHAFAEGGTPLNLIHRDISPENLLVGRNGVVKVADFGIARVAGQKRMTLTGTVRGKLVYMAPEQMQGEAVDCRVDVFALGIVLYELICGRRPFEAKTEVDAMRAILTGTMIPAVTWRPDMPPELQQIIDKAMAPVATRFADCTQLQTALERFIAMRGVVANTQSIGKLVEKFAEPVVAVPAAAQVTVILPPKEQKTIQVRPPSVEPVAAPIARKRPWLLIGIAVGVAAVGAFAVWPAAVAPAAVVPAVVTAAVDPPAPAAPVAAPAEVTPVITEADYPVPPPPPAAPRPGVPAKASKAARPRVTAARLGAGDDEPEPKKVEVGRKDLKGRITGSPKGVEVHNDTAFPWNGCEVRLPFRKYFRSEQVQPGGSASIKVVNLENDHREPDPHMKVGWAMVRCSEGGGYIWWGPKVL